MTNPVIIGNATLYLGDCREIIPTLTKVDAVVTDPPYGIGFVYGDKYSDRGGDDYMALLSALKGLPIVALQYPEETMRWLVPVFGPPDECFVWAYNANTPRQSRLWSFWGCDVDFKRVRVPAKNPTDPRVGQLVAHYDWTTDFQQVKNVSGEKEDHPCQIPTALVQLVLGFLKAQTILDPFMGSGTTGVSCMNLGRKFIGIEIEPKYFDIACRRIEDAQRQSRMFA